MVRPGEFFGPNGGEVRPPQTSVLPIALPTLQNLCTLLIPLSTASDLSQLSVPGLPV